MDGADDVIIGVAVGGAVIIPLDAQADVDLTGIFLAGSQDSGAVFRHVILGHAGVQIVWRVLVAGKTDCAETQQNSRLDQFVRRVFAVAKACMCVEVCVSLRVQNLHSVIFSCLTLWSMTWRDASSAMTWSVLMPISTIMTSTW